MDVAATRSAIRSLSIEDRIRLVEGVWDDIAADQGYPDLSQEQKRELERRLADDETNPDDVISWEIIKSEAGARSRAARSTKAVR